MNTKKTSAYVNKNVVYHEDQKAPYVYFDVFIDEDQITELSFERLTELRDLLNRVIAGNCPKEEGGAR